MCVKRHGTVPAYAGTTVSSYRLNPTVIDGDVTVGVILAANGGAVLSTLQIEVSAVYFYVCHVIILNETKDELATWSKIGVQTIYRGGGEERKSEINWITPNLEVPEM